MRGPRGSCDGIRSVTPPLSLSPTPVSAMHTYIRVRGVCELSMVEQWFVLYAEEVLK